MLPPGIYVDCFDELFFASHRFSHRSFTNVYAMQRVFPWRKGALVEAGAYVGAGSVVPPGRLIPAGEHWAGNPVVHVGKANADEISAKREAARGLYEQHMDEFLVYNTIALKQ